MDEFDRHAGKAAEDRHPVNAGTEADPSDYGDPRVAQPGEDPPGEDAMRRSTSERPSPQESGA